MCKRVQLKRIKDWRTPANTKIVDRRTKWGNPVKLEGDCIMVDAGYRRKILSKWVFFCTGNMSDVLHLYTLMIKGGTCRNKDLLYWFDHFRKLDIRELKGKNLACWCKPDEQCHADILLKYANE